MNSFYVITNTTKDPDNLFTDEVKSFLRANNKECVTKDRIDEAECVIVLGGDGTVLQARTTLLEKDIPFLGINLGTMGYLAEVEKNSWEQALIRLFNDDYQIEERMMLEGIYNGESRHALNDIVFARTGPLRLSTFDVYVNDQFLNTFNADGIIVSTPTGSTAYNLSAGGPIVEPGARLILLTPLCPHTLSTRSIVLSADDEITIEIGKSTESVLEAEADFDGKKKYDLRSGENIVIKKSPMVTKLIKLNRRSFLETLHRKMSV